MVSFSTVVTVSQLHLASNRATLACAFAVGLLNVPLGFSIAVGLLHKVQLRRAIDQ